jgi:hypothetical protein
VVPSPATSSVFLATSLTSSAPSFSTGHRVDLFAMLTCRCDRAPPSYPVTLRPGPRSPSRPARMFMPALQAMAGLSPNTINLAAASSSTFVLTQALFGPTCDDRPSRSPTRVYLSAGTREVRVPAIASPSKMRGQEPERLLTSGRTHGTRGQPSPRSELARLTRRERAPATFASWKWRGTTMDGYVDKPRAVERSRRWRGAAPVTRWRCGQGAEPTRGCDALGPGWPGIPKPPGNAQRCRIAVQAQQAYADGVARDPVTDGRVAGLVHCGRSGASTDSIDLR